MFLRRTTIDHQSDEDLLARAQSGQQAPFAALWDRYADLLFGVGMKYLKDTDRAKDVVVELFGELPALIAKHEVKVFRPWIHTVMRNRCLMLLRKHEPVVRIDDALLIETEENPADLAPQEATLQQLEAAIDGLKDAQRTCIRLFYLERQSYQQTAAHTGFSVDHVRSHIQNGRRNLRLILSQHADQDQR